MFESRWKHPWVAKSTTSFRNIVQKANEKTTPQTPLGESKIFTILAIRHLMMLTLPLFFHCSVTSESDCQFGLFYMVCNRYHHSRVVVQSDAFFRGLKFFPEVSKLDGANEVAYTLFFILRLQIIASCIVTILMFAMHKKGRERDDFRILWVPFLVNLAIMGITGIVVAGLHLKADSIFGEPLDGCFPLSEPICMLVEPLVYYNGYFRRGDQNKASATKPTRWSTIDSLEARPQTRAKRHDTVGTVENPARHSAHQS
eukprot:gb/GECG01014842.1/.p1 GENE.gb/GECG01014842.1/~~gb/GECG01014842.1/.p1  ORF type:complete len:257 (+),score=14.10 gb/GECG01014842.1/:1-771(+)